MGRKWERGDVIRQTDRQTVIETDTETEGDKETGGGE